MSAATGGRRRGAALHLALALVAYVPLLWSAPGRVGADTKTYLYLDPSRLLARAPYLWDEHIGLGTVSHQTIGYLFPMGPYYWCMDRLGLQDWVAQRLWLGSLLFAAGAGVLFLLRTLRWRGRGALVAAFAYLLTPYVLDYAARISVILMPYSALPWLLGCTIRATRDGRWRWPAVFALVLLLVGGVNATSLVLVGLGPLWWLLFETAIRRTVTVRRAIAVALRIGVLSLATSLWWIAGLAMQGRYGINILRYTETYETVARTATAPELLRGLGYWFFYGSDKLGPWIEPGKMYTKQYWLITAGYAIAALALYAAAVVRSSVRAFAVGLVLIGVAVSVGAHPMGHPTVYGRLFKAFVTTDRGMSMRSTPRAAPLVVLGLALLLATGVRACSKVIAHRQPQRAAWPAIGAVALLALNQPPLFIGQMYGKNLQRPEHLPSYWTAAAKALERGSHDTRILEEPGSDFASYRWGNTVDPVTPGLLDRPYVARELIPWGSPVSAALLNAFDRRLQEGVFEPASVAPFARLISAGDVVLRSDLQYERFRTPRPRLTWLQMQSADLENPVAYTPPTANQAGPKFPLLDELELSTPDTAGDPPAVASFGVAATKPIVSTAPATAPLVVDGDGEGLVDAAAAGLLDRPLSDGTAVLSSAALTTAQRQAAIADGGWLLVTDSNRKAARRWGTVRENVGYTERADESPLEADPTDNRLDQFPGTGTDAMTVAEQRGVASVEATSYGNPVSYTPEDRAANALDGDPLTAWRVGAFSDVTGERLAIELGGPITTDHVRLLQPITGPRNRWIRTVRLRFDGGHPIDVNLDDGASRTAPGQVVSFPSRRFTTLTIEIRSTNIERKPSAKGLSPVGFAEVDLGGARLDEVLRLPTDGLATPAAATARRLTIVMARDRANPAEPVRADPQPSLARTFTLPAARAFELTGTARLDAAAPDDVLESLLGATASPVVSATSNARLPGDLRALPVAAIDGDPTTAYETPFVFVPDSALTYTLDQPLTVDHLDLQVVADGRHSLPTKLAVSADGGTPVMVDVPAIRAGAERGHVEAVSLQLPAPVLGRAITVSIAGVDAVQTVDYYAEAPVTMPIGIAELGVAGLSTRPVLSAAPLSIPCRSDLLTIDDQPFPVRISATMGDALDRNGLAVEACGEVHLAAGAHVLRTAKGRDSGIDLDRLVLDSVLGSAGDVAAPAVPVAPAAPAAPVARVVSHGPVRFEVSVDASAGQAFWIELGQSHNAGWHATVKGQGDLGESTVVDGYANGWLVHPSRTGAMSIVLEWTPQKTVWKAIGLSVLATVGCLGLAVWPRWRGSVVPAHDEPLALVRAPAASVASWWRHPVLIGVVLGVLAGPLTGVVSGVAAAVLRQGPSTLRWWRWAAPALLATTAVYVIARSLRFRVPAGFDWPTYFEATHELGWLAIGITVAIVAAGRATTGSRPAPEVTATSAE